MNTGRIRKICLTASLLVLSLGLSYLETLIPYDFAVPGIKLGLANIAVVFTLYRLSFREAAAVSILRVFLSALLFGTVFSMIYSLSGAVLSLIVMGLLKRSGKFAVVTVSITGAVCHNIGQILAAVVILGSAAVFSYLPVLLVSGVAAGIVIGILSGVLVKRIPGRILTGK